ncbi:DeoR family transcriptional regulator [Deinococcus radiophilus]|uniref:DeoR family transcriptional regulator n=1 Tax=Deinococcus radiophilus TaxID=32062 RepID=UPI00361A4EEC
MSNLHPQQRQQRILDLLSSQGFTRTQGLIAALGASGATVRRDLEVLAAQGQLERLHGGAAPLSRDIRYLERQSQSAGAKQAWLSWPVT